jgi:hypothetical protein
VGGDGCRSFGVVSLWRQSGAAESDETNPCRLRSWQPQGRVLYEGWRRGGRGFRGSDRGGTGYGAGNGALIGTGLGAAAGAIDDIMKKN